MCRASIGDVSYFDATSIARPVDSGEAGTLTAALSKNSRMKSNSAVRLR